MTFSEVKETADINLSVEFNIKAVQKEISSLQKEIEKLESKQLPIIEKFENLRFKVAQAEKAVKDANEALLSGKIDKVDYHIITDEAIKNIDSYGEEIEKLRNEIEAFDEQILPLKEQLESLMFTGNRNNSYQQMVEEATISLNKLADVSQYADDSLQDLDDTAKETGDGFSVTKGVLSNFISNGLAKLSDFAAESIKKLAGLADETREYRSEMGKLQTAFKTNNLSADAAKKTYQELYSIIGETDQCVEASQQIALLSTNEQEAAQWAEYAAGVFAKFGDALQPETFYEAANETLKLGEATGAYTQLLEGCGVNVDEFNTKLAACSTESEKQQFMLETTESLLGDASEAYKAANENIINANKSQSDYNDRMAKLGEIAEPITTSVKDGFGLILDSITGLIEGVDTDAVSEVITGGFQTFIDETLPIILDGLKWVIDNKDTIISGIAGIGAAFAVFEAASLINQAVTAFKALKDTTSLANIAQQLFNGTLLANPIAFVVTVVTSLIAALVTFIATNEDARTKVVEIWGKIKQAFSDFGDKAKETFNNIKLGIINGINSGLEGIEGFINSIIKGLNWIVDKINSVLTITIPDWIPEYGGKTYSPGLSRVSEVSLPRIPVPALASGAVLPPNKPFYALVGDQKHGTNVEAPLTTIEDALRNVMGEQEFNFNFIANGSLGELIRLLDLKLTREGSRKTAFGGG